MTLVVALATGCGDSGSGRLMGLLNETAQEAMGLPVQFDDAEVGLVVVEGEHADFCEFVSKNQRTPLVPDDHSIDFVGVADWFEEQGWDVRRGELRVGQPAESRYMAAEKDNDRVEITYVLVSGRYAPTIQVTTGDCIRALWDELVFEEVASYTMSPAPIARPSGASSS